MRRLTMGLALVALTTLPAGLGAQQATDDTADRVLREMVAAPTPADLDRQAVSDWLRRDEVRTAAEGHGIDVERLGAATATLGDEAAADLAERVRALESPDPQVGGDTFVVSSTVIIIALLIAILIAVD